MWSEGQGWGGVHLRRAHWAQALRHSPVHRGHKNSNSCATSHGVEVAQIKANKVKVTQSLLLLLTPVTQPASQPTGKSELRK